VRFRVLTRDLQIVFSGNMLGLRTAFVVLYTSCSPARELQTKIGVRGSAKEKHANG